MKKTFLCLLVFCVFLTTAVYAQKTTPEEYIIEKNDTLWDISDKKLGDTFLWPKLWNVNPHIENPDLIYPGTKIIIPSREELMSMPDIPRGEIPVSRKQKMKKSEPKSVWKYEPVMQKKHIIDKRLYIASGWIEDKFPGIGEITSSPMNQHMSSKNDFVYIKLPEHLTAGKPALILSNNEGPMANKRFFAIRDVKTVKHPVSGEKIGHQIRITGILEITGMDGDMTKAKVIDSFEDIQTGDGLLPYQELEAPLIPANVRTPAVQGHIIESHLNSYLLSEGNVLFLDRGENDGLQVGDVFAVLSQQPAVRPIGKIQIVSLQPATSGAVLLESTQEVTIGAMWGQTEN